MPLWATLFSRLLGERVSRSEVAGIALGLTGVLVMQLGGELRASRLGTLLAVVAPLGWALGSLASRRLPLPEGAMRTATQMMTGGVVMALVSAAKGEHAITPFAARAVLAVVYLTLVGSLVGFTAYSYLLKHTRAAVATSYAYVNPIIAVALGVGLGGEKVDAPSAAGMVIVLGAVALVALARTGVDEVANDAKEKVPACHMAAPRARRGGWST
jgi:drug/metabolite transporter (DMT)-like permease